MTAAFATLFFLTTLWMLVVVGAAVLDRSGSKIMTALRGRSTALRGATVPVRIRHQRYQPQRPIRATARMRAAA